MPTADLMTRETIIERFRERIALGRRTKLFSSEFEQLVTNCVQRLAQARSRNQIQNICRQEIALLEEGYPRLTLASDYIPKYRKAIEQAISDGMFRLNRNTTHSFAHRQRVTGFVEHRTEHWALTFFKYGRAVYEDLDPRSAQPDRSPSSGLPDVVLQDYLDKLQQLLRSPDKFQIRHQVVAISGLTGLRLRELFAPGNFTITDHPYLIHFEAQTPEGDSFEVLTLMPAVDLILEILNFRASFDIAQMMQLQEKERVQAINKFDAQVNRECHKYLGEDIVPLLDQRRRVTLVNLRFVWEAICVGMFCPQQQRDAFVRQYLRLGEAAAEHRLRYRLLGENKLPLVWEQARGARLDLTPPLPIVEDGVEDVGEELMVASVKSPRKRGRKSQRARAAKQQDGSAGQQLSLDSDAAEQLEPLLAQLRAEWQAELGAFREELGELIAGLSQPRNNHGVLWFAEQIRGLEQENQDLNRETQALTQECHDLKLLLDQEESDSVQRLKAENQALTDQLQEAQAKLEGLSQLLMGKGKSEEGLPQQPEVRKVDAPQRTAQRKVGRKPGGARSRAQNIFDALRAWNTQHPNWTVALSPGLLETHFKVHRKAAKAFCEEFSREINEHHAQIGVERAMTHNRGNDLGEFKAFVAAFH